MLKLPSMGESVTEATLTSWLKEVGDTIAPDESVVEVATDKVDSDVPSETGGVLIEKRFNLNDVIQVGEIIAVIETDEIPENTPDVPASEPTEAAEQESLPNLPEDIISAVETPIFVPRSEEITHKKEEKDNTRFYSPLVKSIAKEEGISPEELETIEGSGKENRVTKKDILTYLKNRGATSNPFLVKAPPAVDPTVGTNDRAEAMVSSTDQHIEMTRMGQLISQHMTASKNTSVHVQTFVEADVTELWEWRERNKAIFQQQEGEKLTFTPLFIAAVVHALKNFPLLNSSVSGNTIIQKRAINIGMATALPDGNLIVPVIKKADHLNLVGLAKAVNDFSNRARLNQLQPDEVQGGTYTVTNIGNFGSLTGTPIINQPQVGILALGVIRKMPAVIETADGDFIGIRRKIILAHSYDHRIINGAMGGQFVKTVADYLEKWDASLTFNQ